MEVPIGLTYVCLQFSKVAANDGRLDLRQILNHPQVTHGAQYESDRNAASVGGILPGENLTENGGELTEHFG